MRSTLLLAGLLVALGALAAQEPAPKAPQPPVDPKTVPPTVPPAAPAVTSDFFPSKKGTKWTYKYAESEVIMEVKDTDKDVKIDTLSNQKVVASETLKIDKDGIYRTKINNLDITPPLKILELETKDGKLVPKAKGASWKVNVKIQNSDVSGTYTIVDTKTEKLPINPALTTTLVEAKLNIGGTETTVRYWFAKDYGQVKVSYTIASVEQAMELKAFEAGK